MMTAHLLRRAVALAAGATLFLFNPLARASESTTGSAERLSPEDALKRLVEANGRFVANKPLHPHADTQWRQSLVGTQHPFAVILGCSDSRVPAELVFDQGFGDLFVIRVAGNAAGVDECGSIEYAVEHLGASIVVVLGHESCGAVTAALGTASETRQEPRELQELLEHIRPSLRDIPVNAEKAKKVETGVEANVRTEVLLLQKLPMLHEMEKEHKLKVVGGVYHLGTGLVTVLDGK